MSWRWADAVGKKEYSCPDCDEFTCRCGDDEE